MGDWGGGGGGVVVRPAASDTTKPEKEFGFHSFQLIMINGTLT